MRQKVEKVVEEVDPLLLTCCNGGCNQKYREEDNHDRACQYHCKPPVFWDGGKYWACCPDQKKWDWEDFICIPGCTIGRHSNVPPPKMVQEEMNNAPIAVPQGENPLTMQVPGPEQHGEAEVQAEEEEDMVEVPDIAEDGTAICGNAGCRAKFNVNDARDPNECKYHVCPPVFHDGKKGYDCCNVHVYDFDDFLRIPTCAVGTHTPRMKKVAAGGLMDPE